MTMFDYKEERGCQKSEKKLLRNMWTLPNDNGNNNNNNNDIDDYINNTSKTTVL